MAWRKGHLLDLGYIPCGNDHTARVRIVLYLVDHVGKLVDSASVRSRPAAPLMAVYRAQVAVFVSPFIPDGNSMILEIFHVCIACNEPQKLIYDRFQMDLLCGKERESFAEVIAHLIAEHALRAGTGAVRLHGSVFTDMT